MIILRLAWRNILRQKRRSLFSLLSIAFGYFIISVTLSIQEGSYNGVIDSFTTQFLGHIRLHKAGYNDKPSLYKTIPYDTEVVAAMESIEGVRNLLPRVRGFALLHGQNRVTPASLVGVSFSKEAIATGFEARMQTGNVPQGNLSAKGVVLGAKLAEILRTDVGGYVAAISQGADGSIANDRFMVTGVLRGVDALDSRVAYLELEESQEFFSLQKRIHEIMILAEDYRKAGPIHEALSSQLPRNYEAIPWQKAEPEFYRTMEADKQGAHVSFALILSMVVASILNAIFMSVFERSREYGVMMAIGARKTHVFWMIIVENLMLSCLSILVGLIFSLPVIYWFKNYGILLPTPLDVGGMMFDRITGTVTIYTLLYPAILVLIAAFFAAIYPAYLAVKKQPSDALRSY